MRYYVIPARRDSKGYPFKNRKLIHYTLESIPIPLQNQIIITTDDEEIITIGESLSLNVIHRHPSLAQDDTSIKDVMKDVINQMHLNDDDEIVMLYLTYPHRDWGDILQVQSFFETGCFDSLLCSQPVLSHPYLCMKREGDYEGSQLIEHDLYRRQDYPAYFEVSHFVCIFKVGEIDNLNSNMYNRNTAFYPIERVLDVDYESQLIL